MLKFLEFKKDEHLFMHNIIFFDKSFASCDGLGAFYKNLGLSRRPIYNPDIEVISNAHEHLKKMCKEKLASIDLERRFFNLYWLLIRFNNIEFIK